MEPIKFEMVGRDGNAFYLLSAFNREARSQGRKDDEINAVLEEAKSGDYNHLLQTLIKYSR